MPDLLFLTHRVPYPPDKGDRIRTYHLLRTLAPHARVHLACLADEPVPDDTAAALHDLCRQVAIIPLDRWRWPRALTSLALGRTVTEGAFSSPALRRTLRRWARETRFHAALASSSALAPYLRLPELRDVPTVLDLMDVDSQKWLDYAAATHGPRAWLYRTESRRLRTLEQSLPSWAQAITLVSEAEAALFRGASFPTCPPRGASFPTCPDPDRVHAITNGVDLTYFSPSPPWGEGRVRGAEPMVTAPAATDPWAGHSCPVTPTLTFIGALDYLPNIHGATWFCQNPWPEILRRRPEARLTLVGRRPAPAVQRLGELRGVELVGQVPDVRPHLARADVVVVPLQLARGVQNKVLEALAMGKPVVASPASLAGLRARPGTHLEAARTPAEWATTVLALLDDPARRRRLAANGRRFVEENHQWTRCLHPFLPLLGLDQAPKLSRASYALTN